MSSGLLGYCGLALTGIPTQSSMALVSARATVTSVDVLTMLTAAYLYLLCQGQSF